METIKAQDLMIGNHVLCRGALSIVTSINENSIGYIKKKGKSESNVPLRLVKPIPLTENELDKLGINEKGFDKWKFCSTYSKHGLKFTLSNSGHIYFGEFLVGTVHHLQNLVKNLTGKELTYVNI